MTMEYNDSLWDEIPEYAFIALGRRGREEISLQQCFNPKCNNSDVATIHPLSISDETVALPEKSFNIEKKKVLIHCEACGQKFHLIFEQHVDKDRKEEEGPDTGIVYEQVFASNESDTENYGQIGYIQFR